MLKLKSPVALTYMDSNHKRLNQNQLCYHYTIGQYPEPDEGLVIGSAKIRFGSLPPKWISTKLYRL